jgi:hypothetical protein
MHLLGQGSMWTCMSFIASSAFISANFYFYFFFLAISSYLCWRDVAGLSSELIYLSQMLQMKAWISLMETFSPRSHPCRHTLAYPHLRSAKWVKVYMCRWK